MDLERLELEFLRKSMLFEELRDIVVYTVQAEMKSNPHTAIKYFKSRIKSSDSPKKKIDEKGIASIPGVFSIIKDILGVRLICLYKTELQEVCDWVEEVFEILSKKIYLWEGVGDLKPSSEELQRTFETGYTSIHYVARMKESTKRTINGKSVDLRQLEFEIQVRTILEEAWGEFTHPVYKDVNAPQYIKKSYQILSEYLKVINKQVEFLKATYSTLSIDQISKGLVENADFDNEQFHFLDLSGFTVKNSRFFDCRLFTTILQNSKLYDVEFNRCDMMNFDFSGAELKRVRFLNSQRVGGTNFKFRSRIDTCEFRNLHMMNTDFGEVICRNTTFENIHFMNTDFYNAKFARCEFKNTEFMNVFNVDDLEFSNCTFEKVTVFGRNADDLREIMNRLN